jgi:hypothetical protein
MGLGYGRGVEDLELADVLAALAVNAESLR